MTVQLSQRPTDDETTTARQRSAGTTSRRRLVAAGGVLAIGTITVAIAIASAGSSSPSPSPTEPTTVSTAADAEVTATDAPEADRPSVDPAAGPDDGNPGAGTRTLPGLPDGRWRPDEVRSPSDGVTAEPDCTRGGPC